MRGDELLANAQRIVDEELRDRVVAGIAVLDQAVKDGKLDPDWPDRIDPSELLMSSARYCVLGQVFRDEEPTQEQQDAYVSATGRTYDDYDEAGYVKGLVILDGDVVIDPAAYAFEATRAPATVHLGYDSLLTGWRIALDAETGV